MRFAASSDSSQRSSAANFAKTNALLSHLLHLGLDIEALSSHAEHPWPATSDTAKGGQARDRVDSLKESQLAAGRDLLTCGVGHADTPHHNSKPHCGRDTARAPADRELATYSCHPYAPDVTSPTKWRVRCSWRASAWLERLRTSGLTVTPAEAGDRAAKREVETRAREARALAARIRSRARSSRGRASRSCGDHAAGPSAGPVCALLERSRIVVGRRGAPVNLSSCPLS